MDGFSNPTAPCPAGLNWAEKRNGYSHQFSRWAKFGLETKAVMHHKKDDVYYPVTAADIAGKGQDGFKALCFKRYQTYRVSICNKSTHIDPIPKSTPNLPESTHLP